MIFSSASATTSNCFNSHDTHKAMAVKLKTVLVAIIVYLGEREDDS
jgi:uncharacterized membrane protein YoaT (DUF817 family)